MEIKLSDLENIIGSCYRAVSPNSGSETWIFTREWQDKMIEEGKLDLFTVKHLDNDGRHLAIDMLFRGKLISVVVEIKNASDKGTFGGEIQLHQLNSYMQQEKVYRDIENVIGILYHRGDGRYKIYLGSATPENELKCEKILHLDEFYNKYFASKNNREMVMKAIPKISRHLNAWGIPEKKRVNLVALILLTLMKDTKRYGNVENKTYKDDDATDIVGRISSIVKGLLGTKRKHISDKVLKIFEDAKVMDMSDKNYHVIFDIIMDEVIPHINVNNVEGQDIIKSFFVAFMKYVQKDDKNQAFTPDHWVDYIVSWANVKEDTVMFDPNGGSLGFGIRTLCEARSKCKDDAARAKVNASCVHAIELDEDVYVWGVINLLIHDAVAAVDNIVCANCFDEMERIITTYRPKFAGLNPPYNAPLRYCDIKEKEGSAYAPLGSSWVTDAVNVTSNKKKKKKEGDDKNVTDKTEDPTCGFHFVVKTAQMMKNNGGEKLACVLMTSCASGVSGEILRMKQLMLGIARLEAVISLPTDVFHPGANVCTCIMFFDLTMTHAEATKQGYMTFLGNFKDDGFVKRKIGRVEREDGAWAAKKKEFITLHRNSISKGKLSTTAVLTADDEWLAEKHIDTNQTEIVEDDFDKVVRDYLSFLIQTKEAH